MRGDALTGRDYWYEEVGEKRAMVGIATPRHDAETATNRIVTWQILTPYVEGSFVSASTTAIQDRSRVLKQVMPGMPISLTLPRAG